MQRHNQIHRAQARGQVSTAEGRDANDFLTQLGSQNRKLVTAKLFKVGGGLNGVE